MRTINITGGIGAGKSEVLDFLRDNYNCKVIRADDVAHKLMSPDGKCYSKIIDAFQSEDLLQSSDDADSSTRRPFDRAKLAAVIFSDSKKREKINSIVHPAVKEYILNDIELCKREGIIDYYFFEAALIIEEGYDKLLDETWYIYASVDTRLDRLMQSRGYSRKKALSIMNTQLSEEEYRSHATRIFNNDGTCEELFNNIRQYLHCE